MSGVESVECEDHHDGEARRVGQISPSRWLKNPRRRLRVFFLLARILPLPKVAGSIGFSGLIAKNLAEFAIELGGVLGSTLDQVDPFFLFAGKIRLTEQVRGLHDRLERVAEIVGEGSQAGLHGCR